MDRASSRHLYAERIPSASLSIAIPARVKLRLRERLLWEPRLGVCVALYGASLLALILSPLGHHWPFVDLDVYRRGGQAIVNGAHLYALRFPGALAFTYPPTSALAFTLLTPLPLATLEPLISAASLLLLPLMLGLALRLPPVSERVDGQRAVRLGLLAAAAAVWLEPVWTTLRYGQIDILIAALIVYDLGRPDASRWKGAAIGLASAVKLTPAIFVAYLLLSRRYRAAAVSVGVFLASVAVGFAFVPRDSREFWGGAFIDPGRVGRIENAANQSLRGASARLEHSLTVSGWWLAAAAVVAVTGLLLAARAARRGNDAIGFSLCALTGLLISPVSWSHHWVLAVPALALLLAGPLAGRRRIALGTTPSCLPAPSGGPLTRARLGALAAALLAALIGFSHMIWWVPVNHPRHSELHLAGAQLLYADAYVILALGALAVACFVGAWPRGRPGDHVRALG